MNIVKIESGDYMAEINLSRGANCIRFINTKYHVSALREPDYSKEMDNPYLYGMPILFPVNRIHNGRFMFDGREYIFPINEPGTNCHLHGFLHQAAFTLTEQGVNFVRCQYASDELYSFFPHKFRIEMFYSVSENGLLHEVCIHNLSEMNMPSFLGFHTTFNVPFVQGASAENVRVCAQIGDEAERDMTNYLPTGNILPGDHICAAFNSGEFAPSKNKISKHYKSDQAGAIELIDTEKRLKIVYRNDEKYGWRLFYNGGSPDFICLEPQTCMANCQNSKLDPTYTGFDYIAPYSCKKYVSQMSIQILE